MDKNFVREYLKKRNYWQDRGRINKEDAEIEKWAYIKEKHLNVSID